MIDAILGIDVSKNTLDVSISSCTKVRTKEGVFETVHHQDRSIFYNQVEATKVVPNSGVGDCPRFYDYPGQFAVPHDADILR